MQSVAKIQCQVDQTPSVHGKGVKTKIELRLKIDAVANHDGENVPDRSERLSGSVQPETVFRRPLRLR